MVNDFLERDYLDMSSGSARCQWKSIAARDYAPAGKRQVAYLPVEALLCLAAMYVVDHSRFGSSSAARAPEPVQELARLFKRPPSSILAKMANLDGTRSHGGRWDLIAGAKLRSDPPQMTLVYRTIVDAARDEGIGPGDLPDFLALGDTGELVLLGQDELELDAVDSMVESELAAWIARQDRLAERDTVRLLLSHVRVGQHRFAGDVLANCGRACVFCGFSITPGDAPPLLRASHIKPWRDSGNKERLDVRNGIAACPTHDAAFDVGLLTISADLVVRRSPRLESSMCRNSAVRRFFDGDALTSVIKLPTNAVAPAPVFLDWHNDHVYSP